jgi:hypothetical protein
MQEQSGVGAKLYEKLKDYYWFGSLPKVMQGKVQPAAAGALNIYWALAGRPEAESLVRLNKRLWEMAYAAAELTYQGTRLGDTVTVLSLEEFAEYLKTHGKITFAVYGEVSCRTIRHGLRPAQ